MRLKLKTGDIFRFGDSNDRFGYGQILRSDIIQYIVIFEPVFDANASLEEVLMSQLLLAGWTSDARFFSGDWEVVGNRVLGHVFKFPEYKIEISGDTWVTDVDGKPLRLATPDEARHLLFQTSHAPIAFEKAFRAHHGRLPWEPRFDQLRVKSQL